MDIPKSPVAIFQFPSQSKYTTIGESRNHGLNTTLIILCFPLDDRESACSYLGISARRMVEKAVFGHLGTHDLRLDVSGAIGQGSKGTRSCLLLLEGSLVLGFQAGLKVYPPRASNQSKTPPSVFDLANLTNELVVTQCAKWITATNFVQEN